MELLGTLFLLNFKGTALSVSDLEQYGPCNSEWHPQYDNKTKIELVLGELPRQKVTKCTRHAKQQQLCATKLFH